MTKLLIALRFYAVGCFSEPLSDMFGVSRSIATSIVSEVSYLIGLKMKNQYINMTTDEEELLREKARFHRFARFPLIIGAIDGTNIRVQSFGGDNAELYRNRKSYFSINCQVVSSGDVRPFPVLWHDEC